MLTLVLRLAPGKSIQERLHALHPMVHPEHPDKLVEIRFLVDGEEWKSITPNQFQRMRPIVAAQNGIELKPDTANPELLQAERDIAEKHALHLDASIEAMVHTVAGLTNTELS